jgi:AcrR family transcriptional regulator
MVAHPPARGTRPANRRELVLAAAAELFHRRGYSNVSMKDIADDVAIGPSALYRHFRNKNDLLEAVVSDGLTTVEKVLDIARRDPTMDLYAPLAAAMLGHRAIGVLWHREARHLTQPAQRDLRDQIRAICSQISATLQHNRPELDPTQADFLAWSMLGAATSVSFHTVTTPVELLTTLLQTVADAQIPPLRARGGSVNESATMWSPSRREAIVSAAIRLFAARGYADVSLEEIGTAVGIAGPSVYNHFSTKADILNLAMDRGNEILRADMHRDIGRAISADDAMRRLVASYRDFALENSNLITLLNSETGQLPQDDRRRVRAVQRQYIAEWMQLTRQVRPEIDDTEARIRVQAALNTMNDIATTPHLCRLDGLGPAVDAVCATLLQP